MSSLRFPSHTAVVFPLTVLSSRSCFCGVHVAELEQHVPLQLLLLVVAASVFACVLVVTLDLAGVVFGRARDPLYIHTF